jgi:antitoxin component of RelBE/YafQ-DinJ toxin-antitoxin module
MALKKFHVGLSAAQMKMLEKLAAKLGLDKTSAVRYCITRIAEQEGLMADHATERGARR